jgi:hypothetical protein
MRLRLVDLPVASCAVLSFVLISPAHAGELEQAVLRGSTANDMTIGAPSYPVNFPAPATNRSPAYPTADTPPPRQVTKRPINQLSGYTFAFGTRVFFSSGRLAKDLFDDPRSSPNMVSRLTYSGLTSSALEGFGRADTPFGGYIKAYAGFSGLKSGTLNDEDFPPGISPYSNTLSQQDSGKLSYGALDVGQTVAQNDRVRASVFVGYGFLNEKVSAFGCSQIASNPDICAPALDPTLLAITEDARWQFIRLGLLAEFRVIDRLNFSAEVAWLPYAQITSTDTHWLRLGSASGDIAGPIPESGDGSGVQIEALLSYAVTDRFTLGVGGRYWYMETHGSTDFESVIVGFTSPVAQPLNFTTFRYGGFGQAQYRFGPL